MRWPLFALTICTLMLSGCLSTDGPGTDSENMATDTDATPVEPYRVDETFDLSSEMDETWSWAMSPDMTGRTTIEYIPDPIAKNGPSSVCYDLTWPQGRQSSCSRAQGSVTIQISGADLLETKTVYDVTLYPNTFDLHVWTESGPDTAQVRVFVETWIVEE